MFSEFQEKWKNECLRFDNFIIELWEYEDLTDEQKEKIQTKLLDQLNGKLADLKIEYESQKNK